MSWQKKEHCWMKASEARAETMKKERGCVYSSAVYAASFHCSAEEWKA